MDRIRQIAVRICAAVFLFSVVVPVFAQQENEQTIEGAYERGEIDDATAKTKMQQVQMQQMQEMMGFMMGQMMDGMAKTMAQKQFAENLAIFTRNYYDALINRGFTEEQALKIVTASGIPSMSGK
ncbi:MAG: hypothetical protein NC819_04065 [Candidatus Omnitrophica bacterium]|nr:hypothetical protein [Candidatus Omnitrophota bacterium]